MLVNRKWQQAPGMAHTLLYPIINKSNLSTSNSFIFHSPNVVVIIDPGNFGEQVADIRQALEGLPAGAHGTVIAFLTHCHVDHCFEFLADPSAIAADESVFVAIQENGIHALSRKDRELTAAGPYRKKIPEISPDICLLSAEDRRFGLSKGLTLPEGMAVNVVTGSETTSGGNILHKQDMSFKDFTISAYFTPGHSLDSVSYQVGGILFVGDAMFASEPFIAGVPGWNRDHALESAENLLWLIEKEKIALVAQGHGDVMTAEKATEKLRKMINRLPGIVIKKEIDSRTIVASSEHAIDVAKEADDIIATMAESLNHVIHYLDFLEESQAALNYAAALDSGKIDELFSAFNEMADEVRSGRLIELRLMHKSAALFGRIRSLLKAEGLECVVGQTLLTRLERLVDDYLADAAGREIKRDMQLFKTGDFLNDFAAHMKEDPHADESIFDTLDDEQAFVKSLIKRLAYKSTYKGVEFRIAGVADAMIRSDRSRLAEILEIIVESMVEEGSKLIVFDVSENCGIVGISLDGGIRPGSLADDSYTKRALLRRIRWIDGDFSLRTGGASTAIALNFSAAPN
jgi:glyoxylase-like metal-dependent hydrolase (beta-lactamase superfamily II)